MGVRAAAVWAGSRSELPVAGESWFVASEEALAKAGCGLPELFERSRKAYPAMHAAIERVSRGRGAELALRLRPLEVFEDDVNASGMGDARAALERRAQVCGMRVVAAMNACAGVVAIHGMPLPAKPAGGEGRLLAMLEEVELMGEPGEEGARGSESRRL